MPCRLAGLFALFFSLAFQGVATGAPGIWLDVPLVKQERNACGAASISMVMQYWNKDKSLLLSAGADPRVIQQALYSKEAKGIFASSMERYFQEAGFRTFVFQGEWMDLKHHLLLGRHMIVCLKGSRRNDPRHYVVVTGLDWQQDHVILRETALRRILRLVSVAVRICWLVDM